MTPAVSLYQLCDLFEFGVVGGFQEVKEGHLGGGDIRAFGGQSLKGDLLVRKGP